MRFSRSALAICLLIGLPLLRVARGQSEPPSEHLSVKTDHAVTWNDGDTMIVQSDSPVTIECDRATMHADRAVIWMTPLNGSVLEQQAVEIALIGNAELDAPQEQLVRSGDRLFVTLQVRGDIRLVSETRDNRDDSASELFRDASGMRPLGGPVAALNRPWNTLPTSQPIIPPTTQPYPREPINFRGLHMETIQTVDDKVAFVLSGGASVYQRRANGDLLELQADRAVMFTQLHSLKDVGASKKFDTPEDAVEAAYLEGDVRVSYTPAATRRAEQRLQAGRLYYEFGTDRAVLTQAVIHTVDPQRQIPVTVRAETVRQLSVGEYETRHMELSTSQFLTPTYSIRSDRAYIRQVDTGDPRYGTSTLFVTHDTVFTLFGAPYFYLPVMSGTMTERGSALRSIYTEDNSRFGIGVRSEWGLFESLGILPPDDLDISYRLDYFAKRGPAGGVNADYQGGYITDTTKEPWDFKGDVRSYIVEDHGDDRLGSERRTVTPPDETRGMIEWEHQHFFPGDWQVQLRGGYTSDPTFLEEYFEHDFDTGLPHDLSAYLKHQRDSEALTLFAEYPTSHFVTTADELQEQVQVERLEMGYRRIGDSFGEDRFTLFSENTVDLLHFRESSASLIEEGFRPGQTPGIPSIAQTGTNDDTTGRGDFRQEVDYPFSLGQFRVVPYAIGRYTGYDDSPNGDGQNRLYAGGGLKLNTAFWRIDDSAQSDLFDIHRVRHVIEPEINLYTSGATRDPNDLFIYDEAIDSTNDISAIQLALHQRWQTKRGGAGQFRSVDFFTLNVEGNFFFNQPSDNFLNPTGFRGLFFPSRPETSLARNSINADALWRISDTTAVLADEQYNLDQNELATTSIGLAISRDPRLAYFVGLRYIGIIDSTIASIASTYQISDKYTLQFSESLDISARKSQESSFTLIRHFDRLFASLTLFYDAIDKQSGFRFGLIPEGLGPGVNSGQLEQFTGPQ